nr:putative ribonuclease H-like domain-containing protein [Tanacetum cinerariifolium]GEY00815.1 putative ribonuclease H-like domain-containing protein [Tanacetum cinerariifolium]
MGTFKETLAEGEEGAFHLGPERPRVYFDLSPEDKERSQGNNARGTVATGNGEAQDRVGNVNSGQARQIKCYNSNGGQDNTVDEVVDELPVQDLALNVDNVFQADECDAFNVDVDEAPTTQTMFMANLSSVDLVYDEAGPPYDSDILFEVYDHDNYQDVVCEHHEVHEMNDDVQSNCVVDSDAKYTGDCNMIPYDQNNREVHLDYLKHLKESIATLRKIVEEARIKRPLDRSLASACLYTKHSQEILEYVVDTWDRSRLRNFMKKFIKTVKFGNDHFGAIMGYEDYVIGDSVISRGTMWKDLDTISSLLGNFVILILKLPSGSTHVMFEIQMSVNGKKYILVIVDDYSRFTWVKFLRSNDETSEFVTKFLITPQQNGVVERQNRTLVEAAQTMLIFSKALMFLWAAAVATACSCPFSRYTFSTTIDQDAPSPSHSLSSSKLQPPISHQGVAAGSTIIEDNPFAHADNNPFVNVFALEPSSEASSSEDASSAESTYVTQPHNHLRK